MSVVLFLVHYNPLMSSPIHYDIGQCSLGKILVARSQRGVCCVMLGDSEKELTRELRRRFPKAEVIEEKIAMQEEMSAVVMMAERPESSINLNLDVQGTDFQKGVWKQLRNIRSGSTSTYLEIAKKLGKPRAVRAVAQACAANHIAIAIPCHRVIRSDGTLSGYRWGVERKAALLEREKK